MPLSHNERGFTLIEVLIVIAVMAILAAILFPVFASAREKGRQAVCQSNMRQIGLASLQYSQDHDEMCVPERSPYTSSTDLYWTSLLEPYTSKSGQSGIFYCPSAGDPATGYFAPDTKYINTNLGQKKTTYCGVTDKDPSDDSFLLKPAWLSYSINFLPSNGWHTAGWNNSGHQGYNKDTNDTGASVSEAEVEDPAGTIHFFDAMCGAHYTTPQTAASNTCKSGNSAMIRLNDEYQTDRYAYAESLKPAYRHFGGFNAIYGDGHVRYRRWGTTTPCEWSIQADPSPSDPQAVQDSCKKS